MGPKYIFESKIGGGGEIEFIEKGLGKIIFSDEFRSSLRTKLRKKMGNKKTARLTYYVFSGSETYE